MPPTPASPPASLHIGAAIDGAGAHPAAWRVSPARPADLFTTAHYTAAAREAERGALDFVTLDDSLALQDGRADRVRGRLDALLTLTAVAPLTSRIGLVPTVTTTHTEPFHVSKAVATLDFTSLGRAGWRVQISPTEAEARHIGRRPAVPTAVLWDEAAAVADVVARLWDSWDDDAEIRDAATGRFIDRDRLHYVDFTGPGWSVKGPSITPRPPQGHPLVVVRADDDAALRTAAAHADAVLIARPDPESAAIARARVRAEVHQAGRSPDDVAVLADVFVLLDADGDAARDRRDRLDALAGAAEPAAGLDFTGTPAGLARTLAQWAEHGAADGFTVHPAVLPADLTEFVDHVVPLLRDEGLFRAAYTADTLRGHFGLPRPAGRYART